MTTRGKNNKVNRVTVLFTEEEYKIILKKAAALHVPMSTICRQYILKGIGTIQQDLFK